MLSMFTNKTCTKHYHAWTKCYLVQSCDKMTKICHIFNTWSWPLIFPSYVDGKIIISGVKHQYIRVETYRKLNTVNCIKLAVLNSISWGVLRIFFVAVRRVTGYYYIDGNCNGTDINKKIATTPEECATLCNSLPNCIGKSFPSWRDGQAKFPCILFG